MFVARLCGQATWPSKMRPQKAIKKSHIIGTFNINGGIEGGQPGNKPYKLRLLRKLAAKFLSAQKKNLPMTGGDDPLFLYLSFRGKNPQEKHGFLEYLS